MSYDSRHLMNTFIVSIYLLFFLKKNRNVFVTIEMKNLKKKKRQCISLFLMLYNEGFCYQQVNQYLRKHVYMTSPLPSLSLKNTPHLKMSPNFYFFLNVQSYGQHFNLSNMQKSLFFDVKALYQMIKNKHRFISSFLITTTNDYIHKESNQ